MLASFPCQKTQLTFLLTKALQQAFHYGYRRTSFQKNVRSGAQVKALGGRVALALFLIREGF
jgi:hypothetical protein